MNLVEILLHKFGLTAKELYDDLLVSYKETKDELAAVEQELKDEREKYGTFVNALYVLLGSYPGKRFDEVQVRDQILTDVRSLKTEHDMNMKQLETRDIGNGDVVDM